MSVQDLNRSLVSLIRQNDYTGVQRLIESGADLDKQMTMDQYLCVDADYRILTILQKNGFMFSHNFHFDHPLDIRKNFPERLRNAQALISEERTARDQHIDDSLKAIPTAITQIINDYDSSSSEEISAARSVCLDDSLQMMPTALTQIINDYDESSEDPIEDPIGSSDERAYDLMNVVIEAEINFLSTNRREARGWLINYSLKMIPTALTQIINEYATSSSEDDEHEYNSLINRVLWPMIEYSRR